MGIGNIWDIGKQGLQTNKQALQTTANNIANANTPGYSRRRAVIQTSSVANDASREMGSGVELKKVIRIHDDFVQKQIVDNSQSLGAYKMKTEMMRRIETRAAADGEQLSQLVNRFFNTFRELSTNPEMSALRTNVGSSAQALGEGIQNMNESFSDMKRELDLRIGETVDQVNYLTLEIAGLNESIASAEARGELPNDLYDRREMFMRDLSSKIDMQVNEDQRGQMCIVSGGSLLISGADRMELNVSRTAGREGKTPGQVDIFVKSPLDKREGRVITSALKNGELAGLLQVRDKVLGDAQSNLDKIAFHITKKVNELHSAGVGLDGDAGRTLFQDVGENVEGSAHRFQISNDVSKNFERIAAGKSGNKGDNEVALAISDLQNIKGLDSINIGTDKHTINESINALVGKIGVEAQKDEGFYEHQKAIVDQLENYRQSISGVSLEEEATNMIQYQTMFNASAKAMKVGEELFDTLLSLKR